MNINNLTKQQIDHYVARALLEVGITAPTPYNPTVDKLQAYELMEHFNMSVLPTPNTDLFQAKANGRVNEDNDAPVYSKSRREALCLAAIGFVFGLADTTYDEMCASNQKVIDEVFKPKGLQGTVIPIVNEPGRV